MIPLLPFKKYYYCEFRKCGSKIKVSLKIDLGENNAKHILKWQIKVVDGISSKQPRFIVFKIYFWSETLQNSTAQSNLMLSFDVLRGFLHELSIMQTVPPLHFQSPLA